MGCCSTRENETEIERVISKENRQVNKHISEIYIEEDEKINDKKEVKPEKRTSKTDITINHNDYRKRLGDFLDEDENKKNDDDYMRIVQYGKRGTFKNEEIVLPEESIGKKKNLKLSFDQEDNTNRRDLSNERERLNSTYKSILKDKSKEIKQQTPSQKEDNQKDKSHNHNQIESKRESRRNIQGESTRKMNEIEIYNEKIRKIKQSELQKELDFPSIQERVKSMEKKYCNENVKSNSDYDYNNTNKFSENEEDSNKNRHIVNKKKKKRNEFQE